MYKIKLDILSILEIISNENTSLSVILFMYIPSINVDA